MKRIIGTLASIMLVFGLSAVTIPNLVAQHPPTEQQLVQSTQYCQVCEWVWSYKAQKYVKVCHLVVCHAV